MKEIITLSVYIPFTNLKHIQISYTIKIFLCKIINFKINIKIVYDRINPKDSIPTFHYPDQILP